MQEDNKIAGETGENGIISGIHPEQYTPRV